MLRESQKILTFSLVLAGAWYICTSAVLYMFGEPFTWVDVVGYTLWLFGVIVGLADHYMHNYTHKILSFFGIDHNIPTNDETIRPWEKIPDESYYRQAVEFLWKGYDYKSIAKQLGVTAHTAETKLSELRKLYGEEIVPTRIQVKELQAQLESIETQDFGENE